MRETVRNPRTRTAMAKRHRNFRTDTHRYVTDRRRAVQNDNLGLAEDGDEDDFDALLAASSFGSEQALAIRSETDHENDGPSWWTKELDDAYSEQRQRGHHTQN
jgi:hypothetical protein